jgi:hypothetical protein
MFSVGIAAPRAVIVTWVIPCTKTECPLDRDVQWIPIATKTFRDVACRNWARRVVAIATLGCIVVVPTASTCHCSAIKTCCYTLQKARPLRDRNSRYFTLTGARNCYTNQLHVVGCSWKVESYSRMAKKALVFMESDDWLQCYVWDSHNAMTSMVFWVFRTARRYKEEDRIVHYGVHKICPLDLTQLYSVGILILNFSKIYFEGILPFIRMCLPRNIIPWGFPNEIFRTSVAWVQVKNPSMAFAPLWHFVTC